MAALFGAPPVLAEDPPPSYTKQDCFDALKQLMNDGYITDFKTEYGVPIFVVNERIWRGAGFRTKQGFAELIKCLLKDSGTAWYEAEIRSDLTNKILAKLRLGKLKESE